ncbi:hypothetical protein PVAND_005860 [Polypedilum vanderplanki]|uniref:glutathione transferase n=1 Tax=Polypedilum vanderplanki TaxID=319348 RepID=A0A9J6C2B5_POLVA|nr:hypothetical protein PVAND_005860 [Polypedilum vanderplanki]
MSKKLKNTILYHNIHSPPSRMCYLTARNLDIDLEIRDLDILKGEQNSGEFLKINPMHQVPTLVHDGFVVTEARAIIMYLATIAESPLYPINDLKLKTLIDSRLFFDATNCSFAVKNFAFPILRKGMKTVPTITRDSLKTLLANLEVLLENSKCFAGDEMTIADFSFLSNVATIKQLGADFSIYPKLNDWYERCRCISGFTENEEGAKMLAEKLAKLLDEPLWI